MLKPSPGPSSPCVILSHHLLDPISSLLRHKHSRYPHTRAFAQRSPLPVRTPDYFRACFLACACCSVLSKPSSYHASPRSTLVLPSLLHPLCFPLQHLSPRDILLYPLTLVFVHSCIICLPTGTSVQRRPALVGRGSLCALSGSPGAVTDPRPEHLPLSPQTRFSLRDSQGGEGPPCPCSEERRKLTVEG